MDPQTLLEYALFQLTPTRTRCDLLVCSGNKKEKLASGLVEPFMSHLKFFKDQFSKGGYSVTLSPPSPSAFWFTKSTLQRLVRFINSPEVLERFIRIEREITQIESSVQSSELSFTNIEAHASEGNLSSSDGSTKKSTDSSKLKTGETGVDAQEENSKVQLQRLLETRKAMLRKEQAMAYARALVAGFEADNMDDLLLFADNFGASRLREACMEFKDLCKKKHNDGLWMDELAAMAAFPPAELASSLNNALNFVADSSSDLNANSEDNNLPRAEQLPAKGQMQMPWPNQLPPYMYNFPGPQGHPYPYPYPGMPPYYPGRMSWPPTTDDSSHGRHHKSSSRNKSKSNLSESSSEEEEDDDAVENGGSDPVSESDTLSKHDKSTFSNGKKNRKKKSSKTVVIRNINYITSNRKNSDGDSHDDDDDSGEDELVNGDSIKHQVDGVLESLVRHHSKSSKSHSKKKKGAKLDSESDLPAKSNENWDAFQNLLLKDNVEEEHFTTRNSNDGIPLERTNPMDLGYENIERKQTKTAANDSFVVSSRNGVNEDNKVNFQDFANGESYRLSMKGRDSSDADIVVSQRFLETDGLKSFSDLQQESSVIRNGREEDWFVVNNTGRSSTTKTAFDDDYVSSMKGDLVFPSETDKKILVDDSFMVQPQSTVDVQYDTQWRTTDVSMVEGLNNTDPTDISDGKVGETGYYEPDDMYIMVSRDSGMDSSVRSSWTPEIDYEAEAPLPKPEEKSAPVEINEQKEDKPPVKSKTKAANNLGKDGRSRLLSRSLPTNKKLPSASRPAVHKSKYELEEENRKRMEELVIQRQKRIAERTAAAGGATPTAKSKTGPPNSSKSQATKNKGGSPQLKKTSSKLAVA